MFAECSVGCSVERIVECFCMGCVVERILDWRADCMCECLVGLYNGLALVKTNYGRVQVRLRACVPL